MNVKKNRSIKYLEKNLVKNNENNIELIINRIESELIVKYKLKKGTNNIEIKLKK